MPIFTISEVKTRLSALLALVRAGEDVVITRRRHPVARIVPLGAPTPRRPGALKGKLALTPAFFEALPAEEVAAWGEDL